MKRLEVKFEVEVPDDMPFDAAEEWISFEINHRGDMRSRHPQMERDLQPVYGSLRVS